MSACGCAYSILVYPEIAPVFAVWGSAAPVGGKLTLAQLERQLLAAAIGAQPSVTVNKTTIIVVFLLVVLGVLRVRSA